MKPSCPHGDTSKQNSRIVEHVSDTRAANKRLDEPKHKRDDDEEQEHPVFTPPRSPAEHCMLFQYFKMPIHTFSRLLGPVSLISRRAPVPKAHLPAFYVGRAVSAVRHLHSWAAVDGDLGEVFDSPRAFDGGVEEGDQVRDGQVMRFQLAIAVVVVRGELLLDALNQPPAVQQNRRGSATLIHAEHRECQNTGQDRHGSGRYFLADGRAGLWAMNSNGREIESSAAIAD